MRSALRGIVAARLLDSPPSFARCFATRRPGSGAKAEGIRYERRAQAILARRFRNYVESPWLYYRTRHGEFWAQPDGMLADPFRGTLTIFEIKVSHTNLAYRQLFELYAPVLAHIFPRLQIACVEVCRWYDPATWTRIPALYHGRLDEVAFAPAAHRFNVYRVPARCGEPPVEATCEATTEGRTRSNDIIITCETEAALLLSARKSQSPTQLERIG